MVGWLNRNAAGRRFDFYIFLLIIVNILNEKSTKEKSPRIYAGGAGFKRLLLLQGKHRSTSSRLLPTRHLFPWKDRIRFTFNSGLSGCLCINLCMNPCIRVHKLQRGTVQRRSCRYLTPALRRPTAPALLLSHDLK